MSNGTDKAMAELVETTEKIARLEAELDQLPERSPEADDLRAKLHTLYVRRNILEGKPSRPGIKTQAGQPATAT